MMDPVHRILVCPLSLYIGADIVIGFYERANILILKADDGSWNEARTGGYNEVYELKKISFCEHVFA